MHARRSGQLRGPGEPQATANHARNRPAPSFALPVLSLRKHQRHSKPASLGESESDSSAVRLHHFLHDRPCGARVRQPYGLGALGTRDIGRAGLSEIRPAADSAFMSNLRCPSSFRSDGTSYRGAMTRSTGRPPTFFSGK